MKYINPCYLNKRVKSFVRDLILDYDYRAYSDLSHSDLCNFAGLLIDSCNKDSMHEFLLESNDLDRVVGSFKRVLLRSKTEDEENFLFTMKQNAVGYFDDQMQAIFEWIQSDIDEQSQLIDFTDRSDANVNTISIF